MRKHNKQASESSPLKNNDVQWYQVPVLWLCIGILIITLIACTHLIMLSLEHAAIQPSENANTKLYLLAPASNTKIQP